MNKGIWFLFVIGAVSLVSRLIIDSDHVFIMCILTAYIVLVGIGYVVKLRR